MTLSGAGSARAHKTGVKMGPRINPKYLASAPDRPAPKTERLQARRGHHGEATHIARWQHQAGVFVLTVDSRPFFTREHHSDTLNCNSFQQIVGRYKSKWKRKVAWTQPPSLATKSFLAVCVIIKELAGWERWREGERERVGERERGGEREKMERGVGRQVD